MKFQKSFVTRIARLSILLAIVHLLGETYFTFQVGQSIVQVLADLIAVLFVIYGGVISLKNPTKNGILCGAWGFASCLNYRAFAWRFDEIMSGNENYTITVTFYILCISLCISAVFLILSVLINLPKTVIE